MHHASDERMEGSGRSERTSAQRWDGRENEETPQASQTNLRVIRGMGITAFVFYLLFGRFSSLGVHPMMES